MTQNEGLRRSLKSWLTLTEVARARADGFLRDLIKTGEVERHKAQDWVENLVKTSGDCSVALISTVRGEIRKPFKGLGLTNVDHLANQGGDNLSRFPAAARKVVGQKAKKAAVKKTPAKKVAARKASARRTAGA